MALLFATLRSIGQRHPPLELPLSLQAPELSSVDLASCPNVIEDASYELELKLNLDELQRELTAAAQERHAAQAKLNELLDQDEEAEGSSTLSAGAAAVSAGAAAVSAGAAAVSAGATLARRDLGLAESEDEISAEGTALGAQLYPQQTHTLFRPTGAFKGIGSIALKINDQDKGFFSYRILSESRNSAASEQSAPWERTSGFTAPSTDHSILIGQLNPDTRTGHNNNQLFLLQYDTVNLSIVLTLNDRSEITLYSGFLLCASQHQSDNRNISQILTELTAIEDDTILDLMFAHRSKQESLSSNFFGGHRAYQSLSSYVALLEQVHNCYRDNYNYFRTLARHMLVKANIVTSFDRVRMLTHQSQMWLTHNLQVLTEVLPEQAAVNYLGKNYLPLQMQSTTNVKSYDTYENRVVVGFLQLVLHNAGKIAQDYKDFLHEHLNSIKDLRSKLNAKGDTYEAPIITLKFLQYQKCEQELEHLYELLTDLNSIYRGYAQLFKLKGALLHNLPRKAKAFQEIKPYAQVFHTINRWFRFGEFSLQKDMLFLQGKTLDKLFEYYCLYRILDMLLKAGFTPISGEASYTFAYAQNEPTWQAPLTQPTNYQEHQWEPRRVSPAGVSPASSHQASSVESASAANASAANASAAGSNIQGPSPRNSYIRHYQRPNNQGVAMPNTRVNRLSARFTPGAEHLQGPTARKGFTERFDPRNNMRYRNGFHNPNQATTGGTRRIGGMAVRANYHYDDPVANTYVLTRGKQKVTVYYQPVISTSAFYNQIFAFRTNGTTNTGRYFEDNFYSPDFILKFSSGDSFQGDDDYVIIDAKFARSSNVIDFYIDDLIKKYSTNTAIAVLRRTQVLRDEDDEDIAPQGTPIEGMPGYEFVGTKAPRMIMALHGRVASTSSFKDRVASLNSEPQGDAAPKSDQARYWRYHNTPMAQFFQPSTNIGVLELGTNESSTQILWSELVRTLPYLERGLKNKARAPEAELDTALDEELDEGLDLDQDSVPELAQDSVPELA